MIDLNKGERKIVKDWLVIPELLRYVLYAILGFSILTLYRQIK